MESRWKCLPDSQQSERFICRGQGGSSTADQLQNRIWGSDAAALLPSSDDFLRSKTSCQKVEVSSFLLLEGTDSRNYTIHRGIRGKRRNVPGGCGPSVRSLQREPPGPLRPPPGTAPRPLSQDSPVSALWRWRLSPEPAQSPLHGAGSVPLHGAGSVPAPRSRLGPAPRSRLSPCSTEPAQSRSTEPAQSRSTEPAQSLLHGAGSGSRSAEPVQSCCCSC
ncbi:unnamed protein product [Boreogadus saida]